MQAKTEVPRTDAEYWQFVFRLMGYARDEHKVGYELLNAGLEGRALTKDSVLGLYVIVARHFDPGKVFDCYHAACLEFLLHNDVPDAEKVLAKSIKVVPPVPAETGIDIQAAMARVTTAGLQNGPTPAGKVWGRLYAVEVLNVALGGEKLTKESCHRLWQAVRALPIDDNFERPRAAEEIHACICKVSLATAGGFGWNTLA